MPSIPHVTTAIARSSGIGPLLRVFPGSNAAEVIRNATVPCIILPSRGG